MGGYEAIKNDGDDLTASALDFASTYAESFNLTNALETGRSVYGNPNSGRILSQFGRLNYAYAGKYLFIANIRRDGSDKFGTANRFGVFPSFSPGWRISEEMFMKNIEYVSNLKIRGI